MKIKTQIDLLKRGTIEIFTEAELTNKLTDAEKAHRQLRIKLGLDPTSPTFISAIRSSCERCGSFRISATKPS